MDARLRRVAKLRLRSSDESLNRRGAILIEDALRTASLPGADSARLLLIRKLPLGRIRADEAPSSIALRIEARCREAETTAVPAPAPGAEHATAVFFEDDLEPYAALAIRLARREDVSAWFWPLAARGWNPKMPRGEALRVALAGALASTAGSTAALGLIRRMLRYAVLDALAGALRWQDGSALLAAFGWTLPAAAIVSADASPVVRDTPSPSLARMAAPWFAQWGAEDARSVWLACALMAVERPALATRAGLPQKAATWIAALLSEENADAEKPRPFSETLSLSSSEQTRLIPNAPPIRAMDESALADPTALEDQPPPALHDADPACAKHFSSRAGLFFVIPVMARLGIAEAPQLTEWSLPILILRAVAERFETLAHDPALLALGDPVEDLPAEVNADIAQWICRLRRWVRRNARMGLHNLVCRPGRIAFTETHIDVLFRLDRADVRVRRAGLDIDPGWTPWLGRVIRFHYLGDDAYDA